jgi:hypothetical protein
LDRPNRHARGNSTALISYPLKFCPHAWINGDGYVDQDLAQDAPMETDKDSTAEAFAALRATLEKRRSPLRHCRRKCASWRLSVSAVPMKNR